jgi:hypothetical protein
MNQSPSLSGWKVALAAAVAASSLSLGGVAVAQQGRTPGAGGAGAAGRGGAGASAGSSEMEDRLMGAMASREMTGLLDHYFQKNNVSAERQATVKSIVAWNELRKPNVPAGRRRQLILDGVRGVQQFINQTTDTELLMRRANELIEYGMKSQVNQIEYFGETPARQAELNGSAEAVIKIFDKTIAEAEAQQNQTLAGQTRPTPQVMQKWQTLDERMNTAKWTKAFASYGLALSLDPASPKRKEVADAAIAFLTEYEKPEHQREGPVKVQLGKLQMVKGDTDAAVAKFGEALKVQGVDKESQYNALFFTALAQLTGKKPDAAAKSLDAVRQWMEANLAPEERKFVSAGVGLLEYRINDARAELAKAPAEKKQFAEAGEAALNALMKEHPNLEPLIKKMLLEKLPADADLAKLDTVLLRALVAKGVDEVMRAKEGPADDKGKPVLERAIQAAVEVQKRAAAGTGNVPPEAADEAAFLEPVFYAKLERHADTIEQSLDYLKTYKTNKARAVNALNNALAAVDALRKTPESTGARAGQLISQTWATAVQAGMKEYTFVYGKRLFDQAKTPAEFKQAADVLGAVPANHPAITHARFFQLSALQEVIDDKSMNATVRKGTVDEIQKLAGDVNQRIEADLARVPEEQKPRLRFYQVSAILLAADLAQKEMKDNAGVLVRLQGFEEKVKGLPKEEQLIGTALRLRVNSYMATGKTQDAVEEVKKLVASQGKGMAGILFTMIGQMDDAYGKARAAGDKDAMRQNSAAQVALITPLIEQTADEKARNAYKQWKADLVLRAARNEDDAGRKAAFLAEAQATFNELLGLTQDPKQQDGLRYKLALVSFELKDYKKVQQEMGQLIAANKLGTPETRESDPATGAETFKENPVYWEGLLRFMQSNVELAKAAPADKPLAEAVEDARGTLRTLYINRGKNVGGRLQDEYLKLRAEILPGWDEAKVTAATPAAAK